MDDSLIIKYIKKRKEDGLDMVIDKYLPIIKGVIRKYLFNIMEYEEECLNDILLSIWNNINSFDESKNSFKNWVISVSKYRAIDYKRKYLKETENLEIDLNLIEDKNNVESNILKNELKEDVYELLKNLKHKDREIFIKYYIEELELQSISKTMNIKESILYNRLSRGRKKLRSLMHLYEF
ncbi:sigma-70 family RNA polymerase sigma factor [Clostridium sp. B9]|uniref:sigma-70 family RNA polymerase sigma factor n=1 Tax=Clostridium sp. B9 TaxID=3423224 RepID=UPI003D2ED498